MAPLSNTDFRDMQGLLRFGYGKLTEACFLLLRIDTRERASNWLAQAPISTAEVQSVPPVKALQIAFTSQGLRKLGVSEQILNGFSPEFLSGMAGEDNRSRRLGDIGENAPDRWVWGASGSVPDLVVLLYARADLFEDWAGSIESQLTQSGFTLLHRLTTNDMGDIEPFGFADGISSPSVDWERTRNPAGDKLHYDNATMLGEFVLGYPNEYGLYTTRPVIEDAQADLPDAEDQSGMKDLGRNGSYLVFRHIDQDVHGFWRFLLDQTDGNAIYARELAERFVGRRLTGEPLIDVSMDVDVKADEKDRRLNQFTYSDDPNGFGCPLGAHIRRANPRNADLPADTPSGLRGQLSRTLALDRLLAKDTPPLDRDHVASTRFHRLLRRGREYGPQLTMEQRMAPPFPDEPASGLHFLCLNANIGRQFEFIQGAWLHNTTFDSLTDENDPIMGNRESVAGCPAANFTIPVRNGIRQKIRNIPLFTTVLGGAYFFLPGVRALRYLARGGRPA